ncbi:MAG: hypothetical protein GVY23_04290 [Spirochaetes bacterium]|jgi:PHD/YefM family antitoxin component YafN of YafNO toxin-antitoxin module|nr:hypothetical protein [Spirochaetota bacterium]
MYNTEGLSAIATVTELRTETADVLSVLEDVPAICVQRNNEPEAAMLSMEMYRALRAELKKQDMSLDDFSSEDVPREGSSPMVISGSPSALFS